MTPQEFDELFNVALDILEHEDFVTVTCFEKGHRDDYDFYVTEFQSGDAQDIAEAIRMYDVILN